MFQMLLASNPSDQGEVAVDQLAARHELLSTDGSEIHFFPVGACPRKSFATACSAGGRQSSRTTSAECSRISRFCGIRTTMRTLGPVKCVGAMPAVSCAYMFVSLKHLHHLSNSRIPDHFRLESDEHTKHQKL